jgi:hypothetical protein
VNVTFAPKYAGARYGAAVLSDAFTSSGSLHSYLSLLRIGLPDFGRPTTYTRRPTAEDLRLHR